MKLSEIKILEAEEPNFSSLSFDEMINVIKTSCSDSIVLIKKNKLFYRGDKSYSSLDKNESYEVDPSKTVRQSANTTNQYTEIFDNHPEMKDWPKRSRSYICTTDVAVAKQFQRTGQTRIVLPFNGVKIGSVNAGDLWATEVSIFGENLKIASVNKLYNILKIENFQDIKTFDEKLKAGDEQSLSKLEIVASPKVFEKYKKDFYNKVIEAYSPKKLGFSMYTTSSTKWVANSEVWISGKCLLIPISLYAQVRAAV